MVRALKYLAAVAIGCVALLTGAPRAEAAFPQRAWSLPEACNSPGGPQGVTATLFPDNSGPGAYVNGNYIAFVCNYGFQRGATSAGVAVSVDYCGGTALAPRRETGNYNTLAGQFTVRSQRWITVGGALAVIVLYTNAGPGGDHFTTQEMVTGTTNLVELNRPGGAVPCPGGGTTQPPGGGGGGSGGWAVTLAADRTTLIAGNDFQLTATANKNPSGTGYRVYIVNQTENTAVFCATATTCLHKDFLNDPGSRTYVAMIANASGQDVQATSAPITVTWSAWSGSVTLTTPDTSVPAGTSVTMTATASPTINGSVYVIRIERQDGNGKTCFESPCSANDFYDAGVTYTYVAKVYKNDGTALRATSAPLVITWEATQEWEGRVSLRANGNVTNVAVGRAVTLRAYVSPGLEGSNYIVQIAELVGANGQLQSCTDPDADRCVLGVTSDRAETRRYEARVVRRDGTGGVKAASEVLEISWGPGGSLTPCENYWIVRKPTGNVTVLIGGTIRRPVAAGDRICPDDVVETPENGSVEAEFSERGYWNPNFGNAYTSRIGPKSQVSIWFGEENVFVTHVDLKAGDAQFTIHGAPPSDFRIKSPTAVASVRGTVVSMAYDAVTRRTTVRSLENDVEVTPTNPSLGSTILHGGEQITVDGTTKSAVTRIAAGFANRLRLPGIAGDR